MIPHKISTLASHDIRNLARTYRRGERGGKGGGGMGDGV
jgi:hypothetical protein